MNHFDSVLDHLAALELLEVCIQTPSNKRARERIIHMNQKYVEFCCRKIRRNGQREIRLEVLLLQDKILKAKESETTQDWWQDLSKVAHAAMKSIKGYEVLL